MGDNTWLSVFPTSFAPNMTWPYDSFNVEDLHTVDNGVTTHLLPLLRSISSPTSVHAQDPDLIIAHFLGVDHVGHRVGPSHPTMASKLTQMNDVLKEVVDLLTDDTLLVLLGDHGMDSKGDHGGDGELEVSSGLWVYSKGPALSSHGAKGVPGDLLPETTFMGKGEPHRTIQQIDLVPTLSLLLGLPIPFGNLGSVIPELFSASSYGGLEKALELNAKQISDYLETYRDHSGGELDSAWDDLKLAWDSTSMGGKSVDRLSNLNTYNRLALSVCRSLWAQFNIILMSMGLVLLGVGILTAWLIYSRLASGEEWLEDAMKANLRGIAGGAVLGLISSISLEGRMKGLEGLDALHFVVFGSCLGSCLVFIHAALPTERSIFGFSIIKSIPLPLILHTLSFFSNSYTIWEDRILLFLLISTVAPSLLTGLSAPTPRLRYRILGFGALFALCVRAMGAVTVCREEQQPWCHVTFYSSGLGAIPGPPILVRFLALPVAVVLPYIVRRILAISKSDRGVANVFLPWILTPALVAGAAFWLVEWVDSAELLGEGWSTLLRTVRTVLARFALGYLAVGGLGLWASVPLCLEMSVEEKGVGKAAKKQVTVLGFANAFGAPYLIFWCIFLGVVYVTSQLTGQIVLALSAVALFAHLEVVDSVRDVKSLHQAFNSASPSTALDLDSLRTTSASLRFSEIAPLALLGLHAFYTTGHQSTIPSIQWKSAFLLSSTVTYPFSPLTVILNTFGPIILFALASPLLALWNVPPLPLPSSSKSAYAQSIRAALGFSLYYATLLFGAALSAGVLRRHLMVWKIFAPRFMAAGAGVISVDLAVLLGIGIGVGRVKKRVEIVFKNMGDGPGGKTVR